MWEEKECDCNIEGYEENYRGFDIYIEPSPDKYRGGLSWSVSYLDQCYETALGYSVNDCLKDAKCFIDVFLT